MNDSQSANSSASKPEKLFSASISWYYRFRKRYGLGSVLLLENAASNSRIETKTHVKRNSHSDRECEPEQISSMDESGPSTKWFLSCANWLDIRRDCPVLNLANQLKENSQEWNDDMDRWVQFCSKVNEVIKQYQLLCNQRFSYGNFPPHSSFVLSK